MNLLDNINKVLKPYAVDNLKIIDDQTKMILDKFEDSDDPKTIIDNVHLSYMFVKKCLVRRKKGNFYNASDEYLATNQNANRFNHVAETFALGMLLGDFAGLNEKVKQQFPEMYFSFDNYWLIISLLHDYGYYNECLNEDTIYDSIRDIGSNQVEINLEKRFHSFQCKINKTYSESEIYKYFKYIKNHDDFDDFDHGIVGGVNGYKKLIEAWEERVVEIYDSFDIFIEYGKEDGHLYYSKYDIIAYKQICYDIMQHNMFKSSEKYFFKYVEYEMNELVDPNIKADDNNPMYMLLSLVDTIEYLKRFCKRVQRGTRKVMKHKPSNIGEKIDIKVTRDAIVIDYTELHSYLLKHFKKEIETDLLEWRKGILGLKDWVNVEVIEFDYIITITHSGS